MEKNKKRVNPHTKSRRFGVRVKFEISAGGIVFKKLKTKSLSRAKSRGEKVKTLIAFILDPYSKWTFAKGYLNKGESLEAAAKREVGEEMGLKNLKVIEKLGKMDFWFRQRENLIHKLVYYFLMEASHGLAKMQPQKKEKIFKAKWIEIDRALDFCGYKNTKPLLKKAIFIIKKQPVGL